MPRVNNSATAIANRAVETAIILFSENAKFDRKRASLLKLDPMADAEMIADQRDHLEKIEISRSKALTTLLGMHEKLNSESWDAALKFAREFASSFIHDADEKKVKQFADVFGVDLESEIEVE